MYFQGVKFDGSTSNYKKKKQKKINQVFALLRWAQSRIIAIIDSVTKFWSVVIALFTVAAVNHLFCVWATLNFTDSLFLLLFPDRA